MDSSISNGAAFVGNCESGCQVRSAGGDKADSHREASFFGVKSEESELQNKESSEKREKDSPSEGDTAICEEKEGVAGGKRDNGLGENKTGRGDILSEVSSEKERKDKARSRLSHYLISGSNFVESKLSLWQRELAALSEKYPEASVEGCLSDGTFIKMLSCGLSVEAAFRAISFDSLMEAEISRAREGFTSSYFAKASRPLENGIGVSSRIKTGGAAGFSKNQRAALAARVFNGEKIKL